MKNHLELPRSIIVLSVPSSCLCRRQSSYCRHSLKSIRLLALTVTLLVPPGTICFAQSEHISSASPESKVFDPQLETRVDSLLQKMRLEEKIGQLVQYSAGQPTGPGTGRSNYEDMIARGQIGSLFNVIDTRQITAYQKIAV